MRKETLEIIKNCYIEGRILQNKFIVKHKQDWDEISSAAELVIQTGHLVQALVENKRLKSSDSYQEEFRCPINNIGDELSDCLLSIISYHFFIGFDLEMAKNCEEPKEKTLEDRINSLVILTSQLLDSTMIYRGKKPGFDRDELKICIRNWSLIADIIADIAKEEGIILEKSFIGMCNYSKI